ncbi:hypothetical protein [Mycoplasma sp. 1012]
MILKPEKTLQELWDEKDKYKNSLWFFSSILILMIILSSALFVVTAIFYSNYSQEENTTFASFLQTILIFSVTSTFLISIVTFLFFNSFTKINKNKNFSFLGGLNLLSFYLIWILIWFVSLLIREPIIRNAANTKSFIFITPIILFTILAVFSLIMWYPWKLLRSIQRSFVLAYQYEQFQKFTQNFDLNAILKDFQKQNIYPNENIKEPLNKEGQTVEVTKEEQDPKKEELKQKLSKLDKAQLVKIAEKLQISGVDSLSKEELIKIIVRLS